MNKKLSLKQDELEKPSKRPVGEGVDTLLFFAKTPEDVVKSLRAGIKINHKDSSGNTALDRCISGIIEGKEGLEDVVMELVAHGGTCKDQNIEQLEKVNPVFAERVRNAKTEYDLWLKQVRLLGGR